MTLAKNEFGEVRSASGIILYAEHTVVSRVSGGQYARDVFIDWRNIKWQQKS